jgi:hypothetical protein
MGFACDVMCRSPLRRAENFGGAAEAARSPCARNQGKSDRSGLLFFNGIGQDQPIGAAYVRSAVWPTAAETRPNVWSEPYSGRAGARP